MDYVSLWPGGPPVSRVAFGCAAIGGHDYGPVDDATSIAAIRRALELGVTLFDVADVYGFGRAERVLGMALRETSAHRAVVATKVGVRWDDAGRTRRDLSPAWIRAAVEGSLERLGVEHIPLYQLHWPDPATPLDETLGAMQSLVAEGKIGAIGVCNFDLGLLAQARALAPVVSNQCPLSVAERGWEEAIRAGAEVHNTPTLAYNVLGHGLFSGKYREGATFEGGDLRGRSALFEPERVRRTHLTVERLTLTGRRLGRTPVQVAIAWALQQPGVACALTGVKHAPQIEENVGGSGWTLTAEDIDALRPPTTSIPA